MTSARGWHEEVCRRLGSIRSVEPLAGTSSRTWKVELCDRLVVVKEHRSRRAREQELHALHRAAAAVRVPAVVAVCEAAVVLEWIPMHPLAHAAARLEDRGRALAALHAVSAGVEDPLGLPDAWERRLSACRARAVGPEENEVCRLLLDGRACRELARSRRVLCHRDPRHENWGVAERGLVLLDFEHARADAPVIDLATLWADGAFDNAEHRIAFAAGYGVGPREVPGWRLSTGLHALATMSWSRRHGDGERAREGQRRLERWLEEEAPITGGSAE